MGPLEVLPALQPVRYDEAERGDLGLHLRDVLPARLLVRALLQAPLEIALGARRARLAEHVESDAVPLRDRRLRLGLSIGPAVDELLKLLFAIRDVALLLAQDDRQRVIDRRERRADHLIQLVLPHLVDEEAER